MSLNVIIPTKNSEEHLEDCLSALCSQVRDVTLVDAHSTDRTREIAEKYGVTILDEQPSSGKGSKRAVACNYGIRNTESEFVGFIDSDVVVPNGWADSLLAELNIFDMGGITSGCVSNNGTNLSRAISRILRLGSKNHAIDFDTYRKVESLPGYNTIYPRKVLEKVGGFSEDIGGCEDWELNYRIRKAGWSLYAISVCPVDHRERSTLKGFFKQMRGYGWSRSRLFVKKSLFTPIHAMPSILAIAFLMLFAWQPLMITVAILFVLIGVLASELFGFREPIVFLVFIISWALGYIVGLLD